MKVRTWIVALCVVCASCTGGGGTSDYDVALYAPRYAAGFEIVGAEGRQSAVITVKAPWQGADSTCVTQLLVQRDGEAVPADFDGQVLRDEARRIVCMSSSHIAMLDAIGEVERVVGVSGMGFVTNATILERRDSIADIGYDGNIDYEQLVATDANLVLLYGVNGASGMEGKLRELGITFVYVGEYLEESPLGKAEWLVALAEMVGKREQGVKVFDSIPQRYDALKAVTASATTRPKVMINTPYGDSWLMAPTGSYVARLIADAGGEYVYRQNATRQSLPIDMEEAYRLTATADVWINVGQLATLDALKRVTPKFADTRPVVEQQVWNTTLRATPSGGNDYWESGITHPDRVLQDLIMIFHPTLLHVPFSYYQRLE